MNCELRTSTSPRYYQCSYSKNNRTTVRIHSKLLMGKVMIMKMSSIPSVTPQSPELLRAGSVWFERLSSMMYQYSVPMASAKQLKLTTPVKPPLTTTKPNVIFISDRIFAIPTTPKLSWKPYHLRKALAVRRDRMLYWRVPGADGINQTRARQLE